MISTTTLMPTVSSISASAVDQIAVIIHVSVQGGINSDSTGCSCDMKVVWAGTFSENQKHCQ